ncbi:MULTISPECIES: 2-amino-4-hydroxy-6-hydroxymethyldihydropteridine diphosphokinase [Geobacillus]|uniref:2-amino-4-hydroxy-6-hydroxymethyldihydropteridine diphosphokinase n=1 Tax=Geobacillus thermocatenulatus TaxID=33938 RepID=A0A226Q4Q5_9BACL|nr:MULTISPECIES: 2-amino-4-hydroxy-6-hydroxymethyldihydropteridine diphosphokinase [Geobacillus]KPC99555.1 2-amino-4-hydroxy-6-hydroxymethyldihydropteridine pyrophosphokinase [Geobacillus sp. BCO2]RAN30889.1 2-amino-4-hydroxy-6-hydroxymethyldihydropteridine pyrophosphokinase [Geobacillus sp. A8]ASS97770.1 2-amino-4-hydroxy-6-hydroxymethyldihydropteridine diphosphokinase [Geobacillus thermocatenulatus]KDE50810.1 2-amino-4-hydroxy-6-hydroxymethyldihydropteridine pyrophosphokinase [Geobacillus sp.
MENIAYLALGSNLGDRVFYLRSAIEALHHHQEILITSSSSIYETDPVGYVNQGKFLNMVIEVATTLSPFALLDVTQQIERRLGRKREIRWGPRTLDLDILLYNHENIETEQLTIPHPRMAERAFVLIPLFEVNSHVAIPNLSEPLIDIIGRLPDKKGVHVWKRKDGEDVFALFES